MLKQSLNSGGVLREYYIAAEEVYHDYAPLKRDLITGKDFTNENQ
jgi:hypothetical protein